MKVLGTHMMAGQDLSKAMKHFGYNGHHNQFRIICKCKSMADANRKCDAYNLGQKVFRSDYTSGTSNEKELNICEKTDIAFWVGGVNGNNYVTIEQVQSYIKDGVNNE